MANSFFWFWSKSHHKSWKVFGRFWTTYETLRRWGNYWNLREVILTFRQKAVRRSGIVFCPLSSKENLFKDWEGRINLGNASQTIREKGKKRVEIVFRPNLRQKLNDMKMARSSRELNQLRDGVTRDNFFVTSYFVGFAKKWTACNVGSLPISTSFSEHGRFRKQPLKCYARTRVEQNKETGKTDQETVLIMKCR